MRTPNSDQGVAKRRKTRKGTFSCWECKHRKRRCEFQASSTSCAYCQRNGTTCVRQEFPDPAEQNYDNSENRLSKVESLVQQLFQQRGIRHPIPPILKTVPNHLSSRRQLSGYLYTNLPNPAVISRILSYIKVSSLPCYFIGRNADTEATVPEHELASLQLQGPSDNPVRIAYGLIQFALCLQHIDLDSSERPELQLDEPIRDAAQRYVDLASRYVTSQNLLMDSLDGLETLVLEACYHINVGNLRAAWLIFRRALALVQLVGVSQTTEEGRRRVEVIWVRLISGDRHLSFILGLPSADVDMSIARQSFRDTNAPTKKLERIHLKVLGRIITRNVKMTGRRRVSEGGDLSTDGFDDEDETCQIDSQLKQALRSLAPQWWALTTLSKNTSDTETAERTARLIFQINHFFLLTILHQPYLLQFLQRQTNSNEISGSRSLVDHNYAHTTALYACRELLSRFPIFRTFHGTPSYRGMDDKAFVTAMLLILAHISGNSSGQANVLDHQRPQDLVMIGSVITMLDRFSCSYDDKIGSTSVEILKNLLKIEAQSATELVSYAVCMEEGAPRISNDQSTRNEGSFAFNMPYFGTLRLVRKKTAELDFPSGFIDGNMDTPGTHLTFESRTTGAQEKGSTFPFEFMNSPCPFPDGDSGQMMHRPLTPNITSRSHNELDLGMLETQPMTGSAHTIDATTNDDLFYT